MPDLFADLTKDKKAFGAGQKQNNNQSAKRTQMTSRMVEKNADGSLKGRKDFSEQDEQDNNAYNFVEEVEVDNELARHIVMGDVLNNPRFKKRRWFR